MSVHGSDSYAWKSGFLTRIDPRVKIAVVSLLLAGNLLSRNAAGPLVIAAAMLLVMVAGRIPYRRQLLMIAFPIGFSLFAVLSQTLFAGTDVMASLGPFDLHLDGLLHGLFLACRIVAGGMIVVVLGATTPLNRLCLALRWYRVPATFVEIAQLTYRYLFEIHAEFARMKEAQRSRLGWSSAANGLASSRMLGGSLFLRVYDRGVRSAEAMRCRGAGPLATGALPAPGRLDLGASAAGILLLVLIVFLSLAGPLT